MLGRTCSVCYYLLSAFSCFFLLSVGIFGQQHPERILFRMEKVGIIHRNVKCKTDIVCSFIPGMTEYRFSQVCKLKFEKGIVFTTVRLKPHEGSTSSAVLLQTLLGSATLLYATEISVVNSFIFLRSLFSKSVYPVNQILSENKYDNGNVHLVFSSCS